MMVVFSFTERMSCCLSSPGQARCFFPTPPPQYYYSSHLLYWSYHPPFPLSVLSSVYLSHRSDVLYLTFPIWSFISSPFYIPSVRPSFRYFQANILHFGNARLALFNVPNVLTISVCIYLFEYADGRSSNVGLRQQRPPTITRERRSIAASGTTWWNRDFTLIQTLYSAIISHCEHVVLVWVCVELGRLSPVAACQIMLAGFPSLSRSNSVLLHLSHRSLSLSRLPRLSHSPSPSLLCSLLSRSFSSLQSPSPSLIHPLSPRKVS